MLSYFLVGLVLYFITWAFGSQHCLSQALRGGMEDFYKLVGSWAWESVRNKNFGTSQVFSEHVSGLGLCLCSPYLLPQSLWNILISRQPCPSFFSGALGILLYSATCNSLPRCPQDCSPCAPLKCRWLLYSFHGVHYYCPSELQVRQGRHQSLRHPTSGPAHGRPGPLSSSVSSKKTRNRLLPPTCPGTCQGRCETGQGRSPRHSLPWTVWLWVFLTGMCRIALGLCMVCRAPTTCLCLWLFIWCFHKGVRAWSFLLWPQLMELPLNEMEKWQFCLSCQQLAQLLACGSIPFSKTWAEGCNRVSGKRTLS